MIVKHPFFFRKGSCGYQKSRMGYFVFTFMALMLLNPGRLYAGYALTMDLDPIAPGVQDSLAVTQGQTFTVDVILSFSGDTSGGLDSYWFSVGFDPSAMDYVTGSAVSIPLPDFNETIGPPELIPPGQVTPFAAHYSGTPGEGPTTELLAVVGRLSFTAGLLQGTFQISPFEDGVFDFAFDNSFNPIAGTFNSGSVSITAVPEPSSLVLAFLGFLACGWRMKFRRLRHRQKEVLKLEAA